jgi:hypothetical protein
MAFVTNEAGASVLHLRSAGSESDASLPKLPAGVIGALRWQHDSRELGFSIVNARGPGDVYSIDVPNGNLARWTNSETAVKTDGFSGSGAGEMEKFRWQRDFGIFVPAAGDKVSRQAARVAGNPRRT